MEKPAGAGFGFWSGLLDCLNYVAVDSYALVGSMRIATTTAMTVVMTAEVR